MPLWVDKAKAGAAIAECTHKDRHAFFEGGEHYRIPILRVLG
jgi:hypothetical protein